MVIPGLCLLLGYPFDICRFEIYVMMRVVGYDNVLHEAEESLCCIVRDE